MEMRLEIGRMKQARQSEKTAAKQRTRRDWEGGQKKETSNSDSEITACYVGSK